MKSPTTKRAFSLIEVVIAIGISAFALTAVTGLLTVALNNGKESTDDTMIASMALQVVSDLQRKDFTTIPGSASVAPLSQPPETQLPDIFFDREGKRLVDAQGADLALPEALQAGAVYKCVPSAQGDADTVSADGSVNLLRVKLRFGWPSGTTSTTNSQTIQASVAKY